MGTGDDFMIACAISDVGSARRLRDAGVDVDAIGVENSLVADGMS
jgi:hypothetical protein